MNIEKHVFAVNECDNGGEQVLIVTEFTAEVGDDEVVVQQKLILSSYSNSATFDLNGASVLTPEILRTLADELETASIRAQIKFNQQTKG